MTMKLTITLLSNGESWSADWSVVSKGGKRTWEKCEGSNQYGKGVFKSRLGKRQPGKCPVCGKAVICSGEGHVPPHKPSETYLEFVRASAELS